MTYSHFDPAMQNRVVWNAGRTVGTKRPLTQKQIWAIRFFLDREERLRDRALFDLAIDSKLRGCDLVKLKIGDLVAGSEVRDRAMIIQRKTGRPVQFEITADARSSLATWLLRRGGTIDDFVFPSRIHSGQPMSTRQYARLVDEWVTAVGFGPLLQARRIELKFYPLARPPSLSTPARLALSRRSRSDRRNRTEQHRDLQTQ